MMKRLAGGLTPNEVGEAIASGGLLNQKWDSNPNIGEQWGFSGYQLQRFPASGQAVVWTDKAYQRPMGALFALPFRIGEWGVWLADVSSRPTVPSPGRSACLDKAFTQQDIDDLQKALDASCVNWFDEVEPKAGESGFQGGSTELINKAISLTPALVARAGANNSDLPGSMTILGPAVWFGNTNGQPLGGVVGITDFYQGADGGTMTNGGWGFFAIPAGVQVVIPEGMGGGWFRTCATIVVPAPASQTLQALVPGFNTEPAVVRTISEIADDPDFLRLEGDTIIYAGGP